MYNEQLLFSGAKQKVYNYSFYGIWKHLLQVFAKRESVAFLVSPSLVPVLQSFLLSGVLSQEYGYYFSQLCPILANLFAALQNTIPPFAHALFEKIVYICVSTYPWLYSTCDQSTNTTLGSVNNNVLQTTTTDDSLVAIIDEEKLRAYPVIAIPDLEKQLQNSIKGDQINVGGFPASAALTSGIVELPSEQTGSYFPFWPKLRQAKIYLKKGARIPFNKSQFDNVMEESAHQWNDPETQISDECTKVEQQKYQTKNLISGIKTFHEYITKITFQVFFQFVVYTLYAWDFR